MSELIAKFDLNDLVFSNKNKEYGAYKLRKTYKTYLSLALWICLIGFFLGTAGPLIYSKIKPKEEIKAKKKKITLTTLAEPPSIGDEKVVEKVDAPPPLKSTIKFLPPVVKPDDQVTDEYIPTVDELQKVDPGASTQEGVEGGFDYSLVEVEQTTEEKVVVEEKEEAFTFVEEMPSFPGGTNELLKFIADNIEYPEIAKRAGVSGKVMVRFIVEKNGDISDIEVIKGIGAGCDEEAVRVCRMMPNWAPGKQNLKPVRVKIVIPFQFVLKG